MTNEEKRELTVFLAEKVMGWELDHCKRGIWAHAKEKNAQGRSGGWICWSASRTMPEWNPLENIADAWMVVEALKAKRNYGMLLILDEDGFEAHFGPLLADSPDEVVDASAPTAPEAICRAALRAVKQ